MTPPLVVVERHRNRKSVPDCDAFQKNAERCKNLTCFALRDTKAASPYRSDAPAYRSEQRLRQRHGWPGWRGARPRYFRCADSRSLVAKTQTCLRVSPSIFDRAPAVHPTHNATTTVRGQTTAPLTRLLPAAAPCWPPGATLRGPGLPAAHAAGIRPSSGRLLALPELNFLRERLCAEPLNER